MSSPFDLVLAESHRAIRFATDSRFGGVPIRIGSTGWRTLWIESSHSVHQQPLVIIDSGVRAREIAWATRNLRGARISLAFLIEGTPGEKPSTVAAPLGWSHRRARSKRVVYFETTSKMVTVSAIRLAHRRLRGPASSRGRLPDVGVVGPGSVSLLGEWTGASHLDESWIADKSGRTREAFDLLFVDADSRQTNPEALMRLVDEARSRGARIVSVSESADESIQGLEPDLAVATNPHASTDAVIGPWVDVRIVNGEGFARSTSREVAAVTTRNDALAHQRREGIDARGMPLTVIPAVRLFDARASDGGTSPDELVQALRPFVAVVDHPQLHENVQDRARLVCWLANGGVPLVSQELGQDLSQLLGSRLSDLLRSFSIEAALEEDTRESYSIDLRREAMRSTSVSSRLREVGHMLDVSFASLPTVSVVMATRRPDYLDRALQLMDRQTYPNLELVIALHGSAFSDKVAKSVAEKINRDLVVLRVDHGHNLGETLNLAVSRASGQVVTKWDDDDWYGAEHIWDLILALEYSQADIVGKAAEFVYLADLDITIRRFEDGADSPTKTLGGGSLTLTRERLADVGGFPPWPRHVDQGLIGHLVEGGGMSYRTHGLGYVLNRHGDHTWDVETDYFLDASFKQWRGLELAAAGIERVPAISHEFGRSL